MFLEISVTTGKLMLAKPTATVSAEWRGMDGLKDKIAAFVYHVGLTTGKTTPKHIDNVLTRHGQGMNGGIRELLPAERGMAVGDMGTNGEFGIE